jgi:short-subunit dehydrogenase
MNIIITGASKGLGRAIAEKFAARGYDLFLCSRDQQTLTATAQQLGQRYPAITIRSKTADLAEKDQALGFGRWVLESGADIDVLVNNAGQFILGSLYDEDETVLERLMAVNLYSAYYLTGVLLPAMIRRKAGHIFNMCSVASLQAYPY